MQRKYYEETAEVMAVEDHQGHNSNPDYVNYLLCGVINKDLAGKRALDFGCGTGRNVGNLLKAGNWDRVDGCDIALNNLYQAKLKLKPYEDRFRLYHVSGVDLDGIPSDEYDFVMSTIVLQHIAVWKIRNSILKDVCRVMKSGAEFSFQMAIYPLPRNRNNVAGYRDNVWNASHTNGGYDVSVDDPLELIAELRSIGFEDARYQIRPEWDYVGQKSMTNGNDWIYVQAWKN